MGNELEIDIKCKHMTKQGYSWIPFTSEGYNFTTFVTEKNDNVHNMSHIALMYRYNSIKKELNVLTSTLKFFRGRERIMTSSHGYILTMSGKGSSQYPTLAVDWG